MRNLAAALLCTIALLSPLAASAETPTPPAASAAASAAAKAQLAQQQKQQMMKMRMAQMKTAKKQQLAAAVGKLSRSAALVELARDSAGTIMHRAERRSIRNLVAAALSR